MSKANSVAAKTNEKATNVKAEAKTRNPYRPGGAYWATVECLTKLGMGKMHKADDLLKMFPSIIGPKAWAEFKAKEARNENGKDAKGRIVQNALVVNRPDYGAPLRANGLEVRKDRNEDGYLFGLFSCKAQSQTVATAKAPSSKPKAAKKAKARKAVKAAK